MKCPTIFEGNSVNVPGNTLIFSFIFFIYTILFLFWDTWEDNIESSSRKVNVFFSISI